MKLVEIARYNPGAEPSYIGLIFAQQGISHEILKHDDGYKLLVDETRIDDAVSWLKTFKREQNPPNGGINYKAALTAYPITLSLIMLGVLGYLVFKFSDTMLGPIQYFYFTKINQPFAANFEDGFQIWRLLTPVFLHFMFMHILLNGLGLWEIGRRLEYYLGGKAYFLSFLCISIFSNCMNYIFESNHFFGGLSGVVYGFLGMVWVFHYKTKLSVFYYPKGVYVFALAWLVGGFFDILGFVNVHMANGAHLSGLLCGLILAYVCPLSLEHRHIAKL